LIAKNKGVFMKSIVKFMTKIITLSVLGATLLSSHVQAAVPPADDQNNNQENQAQPARRSFVDMLRAAKDAAVKVASSKKAVALAVLAAGVTTLVGIDKLSKTGYVNGLLAFTAAYCNYHEFFDAAVKDVRDTVKKLAVNEAGKVIFNVGIAAAVSAWKYAYNF
jgi:hypothetical protein